MLLTILIIAAVWTIISVVVVGCCVSAAQGDGAGWSPKRSQAEPHPLLHRGASRATRRTRHAV